MLDAVAQLGAHLRQRLAFLFFFSMLLVCRFVDEQRSTKRTGHERFGLRKEVGHQHAVMVVADCRVQRSRRRQKVARHQLGALHLMTSASIERDDVIT